MIRNVRETDLGRYECKAENALGMQNNFVILMGNPLKPSFENKSNLASPTSKTLSWQTESLSPIIDYKFKFRKVPTGNENFRKTASFMWNQLTIPADRTTGPFHTKSYKLEALAPSTVYEVMIQARNQYGASDDSKILRFATPSESKIKRELLPLFWDFITVWSICQLTFLHGEKWWNGSSLKCEVLISLNQIFLHKWFFMVSAGYSPTFLTMGWGELAIGSPRFVVNFPISFPRVVVNFARISSKL